jgi:hypothetical protein
MSQSVGFPHFRSVVSSFALVLILSLGVFPVLALPPTAPPLTVDGTLPNLWYGAIPPSGPHGPVLVFVHGLDGEYQDWIESGNCSPTATGCTGAGNDMYNYAYQAGFRTVFLSLNTNNLTNTASIQTNAAMLQTMFPLILSHYGVSKVFFVCHSKGGLDLEAAIANPEWIGIANMVITMGTPNQGDALASWIFLPQNQQVGQGLMLLNPAVQSMEVANVEQLRPQWDAIFQQAQIPFFTLSGNTYTCPNTTGPCATATTGPLLAGITGGTNAPPNDGLVDHPETLLPESYAMELGIVPCNHFELRLGDNTFPFINAQVLAFQLQQPGFSSVATGGFGDAHNTWSWSMAWFNGMLYVGTGREVACVTAATSAIQEEIPTLYPPAIGDCTPDFHYLPLQAEIWQYNPTTFIWTRVYQSPNSLTTTDEKGNTVATARDIGYRSLTLVTEPGGVQALYAGGVTSGEIFECHPPNVTKGCAPQGTWAPPRILRSTTGALGSWAPLPQDPGTFLGDLTENGCYLGTVSPNCTGPLAFPNYSIRSAGQLNGTLFLQVGDFPGVGRVFSAIPGDNPSGGDNNFQWASPPTGALPIWILNTFNNAMYAGAGNPPGAGPSVYGVWKTNGIGTAPYTWTEIIPNGGYATGLVADYAMSLQIFPDPVYCPGIGCLYVGTDRPNELVRIHPDTTGAVKVDAADSWDLLVGNPRTCPPGALCAGQLIAPLSGIGQYFDNGYTVHFWRMGVGGFGGGSLYMGTYDFSASPDYIKPVAPFQNQEFGTDLWRTPDGIHWQFMSKVGLGDGFNTGSRSFASTPVGLFMGTAREVGGTQVFNVDNTPLDLNNDGVIDQKDVNLMTARLNQPARKNDPMDMDGDGKITAKDIQLFRTQCTHPGCAVPAVRPAGTTLASPVLCSAPGTLGVSQVNLSWPAVPGAVDYLVYRIADAPNDNSAPPGDPVGGSFANCTAAPNMCFGYPGPPQYLTRVPAGTYSELPPNNLQALYFVIAEDGSGNLSSPSNVAGGPSQAVQQCQ